MKSAESEITVSFHNDFAEYQRKTLKAMVDDINLIEPNNLSICFFTVYLRRIPPMPRTFYCASGCVCPVYHKIEFELFRDCVTRGDDLTPYQSDKILKANYKDIMLFDWGIHHFHLGSKNGKAFVDRTNHLVYAIVTGADFYCITIGPHGKWAEKDLMEIVYRNWPKLIERYKVPRVVSLTENVTDELIKHCRDNHIQTFIDLGEGNVFAPPGGGYSSSRHSAQAVRMANYWHNQLKLMENWVRDNIDTIRDDLRKNHGINCLDNNHFLLLCDGWPSRFYILHEETRIVIKSFDL